MTAFAPLPEYRHPDALGSVYVNDTTEVNLRELVLASPHDNGAFAVDDPRVEAVLARHPCLQQVPMPTIPSKAVKPAARGTAGGSD